MTTLIKRLRAIPTGNVVIGGTILHDAADELEHLALDLHTERAAVVALTLELANARAADIHSCHADCTRAGCVAGRLRAELDALRKTVEYYRAGQEQRAPKWVPSKVRLAGPVRGDYPIGHTTIAHEGERECKSNRYGAVSVLAENGQWLGVKPCEFEVVEWRENTPNAAKKATT